MCKNLQSLFFKLLVIFIDNFSQKLNYVAKLKKALQVIWDNLLSTSC